MTISRLQDASIYLLYTCACLLSNKNHIVTRNFVLITLAIGTMQERICFGVLCLLVYATNCDTSSPYGCILLLFQIFI